MHCGDEPQSIISGYNSGSPAAELTPTYFRKGSVAPAGHLFVAVQEIYTFFLRLKNIH
jgi:hypothetical protein